MKTFIGILLFAGLTAIAASCIAQQTVYAEPYTPPPAPTVTAIINTVPVAPPALVISVGPGNISRPGSNFMWVDGFWFWDWRIGDYVWQNGFWSRVPFNGAVWIPGFWEFRGLSVGFVWINGGWMRSSASMTWGWQNNRYDYFGRRMFLAEPSADNRGRHASTVFNTDNRPQYSSRSFSSSATQNNRRNTATSRNDMQSNTRRSTDSRNTGTTTRSNVTNTSRGGQNMQSATTSPHNNNITNRSTRQNGSVSTPSRTTITTTGANSRGSRTPPLGVSRSSQTTQDTQSITPSRTANGFTRKSGSVSAPSRTTTTPDRSSSNTRNSRGSGSTRSTR